MEWQRYFNIGNGMKAKNDDDDYLYRPINPEFLEEPDQGLLIENIVNHYQAITGYNYEKIDDVRNAPSQVKIVWSLWLFYAEVAGNGVVDFLWNHCFNFSKLQEIHESLQTVGATRMLKLLEEGIQLSLDGNEDCCEILNDPEARKWAEHLSGEKSDMDAEQLNDVSMDMINEEIPKVLADYIRLYKAVF